MKFVSSLIRVLIVATFILVAPVSVSMSGFQIWTGVAEAGIKKAIFVGLVGKAVAHYGKKKGTALVRQLAQHVRDPKTRDAVFDSIEEYVKKNPKSADVAAKIRRELDDEVKQLHKGMQKGPYNSRNWRDETEWAHGKDRVRSSTVPSRSAPNAKLAGKSKDADGVNIPFDNKGFPVFDKVAQADLRLPRGSYNASASRTEHMVLATRELKGAIKRGEIPASRFTEGQMAATQAEKSHIPGFTWHHHQDLGRMQLIPERIHSGLPHVGGYSLHK